MTPTTRPFETHTDRYEQWFEAHEAAYGSEIAALRRLLPPTELGLEIGVGSGRFAGPLGIRVGLDPAVSMLELARGRGITVVRGVAEALPFRSGAFDTALIVTTICFVDDVERTIAEARRVLEPGGAVVLGYVDRDSPLGRRYRDRRDDNPFYRDATFVSTDELVAALEAAGFDDVAFVQTLFRPPDAIDEPEPVEAGHGDGSFVALRATR
ncbi:MAG: class I SAM-dependent methyltransferase [Halobacteriales archaeon]